MKKKLALLNTLFTGIIAAAALFVLFNVAVAKFENRIPKIFGYSFHIVVTDSMTPEINVGDFILADSARENEISLGDYIIFNSPDPVLKGKLIVHKVVGITKDTDGNPVFTTSGIKQGAAEDEYKVTKIIGRYAGKSVLIGKAVIFLSSIQNLLFLAVIIIIISIIFKQIKNIIAIKKGS